MMDGEMRVGIDAHKGPGTREVSLSLGSSFPAQSRPAMTKLLYKPLGTTISVLGGLVASAIFQRVWKLVSRQDEPPKPSQADRGWTEVLAAAALRGAIFGIVTAAINRGSAVGFERATGAWPGEKEPRPGGAASD
jgi:hypothetical protein